MSWMVTGLAGRPLFNDPYLIAWVITFTHFIASLQCYRVGMLEAKYRRYSRLKESPIFWFVVSALMCGLGLNKQLDLQSLLTTWGRELAKAEGWYEQRRSYQVAFVYCCLSIGVIFALSGVYFIHRAWRTRGVTYLGVVFLITFVCIRAASFHYIDLLLYHLPVIGFWMNASLELGGSLLVATGATLGLRKMRTMYCLEVPFSGFR